MAVQAQYLSNLYRSNDNMFQRGDISMTMNNLFGDQDVHLSNANLNNLYYGSTQPSMMMMYNNGGTGNGTSEQESELTSNAPSGSRKRPRQEIQQQQSSSLYYQQQQQQLLQKRHASTSFYDANNGSCCVHESGLTSTSGRLNSSSPLDQYHQQQNLELDAFIHQQNEKLRFTVEESRKRHCKAIQLMIQQKILTKLAEKDSELEIARRKNEDLEEKIKQLLAENQLWFNVASNNQGIVSSLKATLQQIVEQQQSRREIWRSDVVDIEEGYGDSSDVVVVGVVGDEAQSCCDGVNEEVSGKVKRGEVTNSSNRGGNKLCKVCGEKDVSVLVLPCRHLCLCKKCESMYDTCPICNTVKNASLQIFIE